MSNGMSLSTTQINLIIADYIKNWSKIQQLELTQCKNHNDYVLGYAWSKNKYIQPYSHQQRIQKKRRQDAINALNKANTFNQTYRSFDQLFNVISNVLINAQIIKTPSLWCYDIALRFGFNQTPQILPTNNVYLYRGAFDGAKYYFKTPSHVITKNLLPTQLSKLPSYQIESILCIYK